MTTVELYERLQKKKCAIPFNYIEALALEMGNS